MEENNKMRINLTKSIPYILVGILVVGAISYLARTYELTCNRTSNGRINCLVEQKIIQITYSRDQINNLTYVNVRTVEWKRDKPRTAEDETRFKYTVILVAGDTSSSSSYLLYTFYDKSDATALQSQVNAFINKPDQKSFEIHGGYGNNSPTLLTTAICFLLLYTMLWLSKRRSKLKKDHENEVAVQNN